MLQRLRYKEGRRVPRAESESPIEPLRPVVRIMDLQSQLAAAAKSGAGLDFFQQGSPHTLVSKLGQDCEIADIHAWPSSEGRESPHADRDSHGPLVKKRKQDRRHGMFGESRSHIGPSKLGQGSVLAAWASCVGIHERNRCRYMVRVCKIRLLNSEHHWSRMTDQLSAASPRSRFRSRVQRPARMARTECSVICHRRNGRLSIRPRSRNESTAPSCRTRAGRRSIG